MSDSGRIATPCIQEQAARLLEQRAHHVERRELEGAMVDPATLLRDMADEIRAIPSATASPEEVLSRMGHAQPIATVKDLRALSGCLVGSDDRELVQHAADMIEVMSKYIPSANISSCPDCELLLRCPSCDKTAEQIHAADSTAKKP